MYQPGRLGERRKKKGRSPISFARFLYWLSFLIFLGALVYVLFFSPYLAVEKITVSGTDLVSPAEIQKIAEAKISGKWLDFIPRNNLLLSDRQGIAQAISEQFGLVKNLSLKKKFPNGLEIGVTEYRSSLILCSNGDCFVLDQEGAAFMPYDSENSPEAVNNLLRLVNYGDRKINKGEKMLPFSIISYLQEAETELASRLNLEIEREIETPQLASGDLRLKTKDSWQIYFSNEITVEKELGMLEVVLAEKITPEQKTDLEYLDLRTDNKVYYKFRHSEPAVDENAQPEKTQPEKKKDKK